MSIYVDHLDYGKGQIIAINGNTEDDYTKVQGDFNGKFQGFYLIESITNGWLKIRKPNTVETH